MRIGSLVAVIALTVGPLRAQVTPPLEPRWSAGPVFLGGPGVLGGASVSYVALRIAGLQLAAEASGITAMRRPLDYACLNSWNCSNPPPPPQARSLLSLGINGRQDIGKRWYASSHVGMVTGRWRYPLSWSGRTSVIGLGLGRESTDGRRLLEARWERLGTPEAPTRGLRLSWQRRW